MKFEDEVQELLLLSSLPKSCSGTVTTVSGFAGGSKLIFKGINDLILREDVCRQCGGESSNSLLSTKERSRMSKIWSGVRGRSNSRNRCVLKNRKSITYWNCKEKGHWNQCLKPLMEKGKNEMNIALDSKEDALIYAVEN